MPADRDQIELKAAAARLESDPFFMASILAEYRSQMRLNDQQLARNLRCASEGLINLALCRTPRLDDSRAYLADIQAIAEYVGCDWRELAKIVRTAQSLTTLKRFNGLPEQQLLKAARDKPHSPKPGKRSKSRRR